MSAGECRVVFPERRLLFGYGGNGGEWEAGRGTLKETVLRCDVQTTGCDMQKLNHVREAAACLFDLSQEQFDNHLSVSQRSFPPGNLSQPTAKCNVTSASFFPLSHQMLWSNAVNGLSLRQQIRSARQPGQRTPYCQLKVSFCLCASLSRPESV